MVANTRQWRSARGVATIAWLVLSGVQLVIWLVMCTVTVSLHAPFWLWTAAGGAVLIGAWWYLERRASPERAE